ncbi:autotransporter outer membrane beta-barrel domain-containing protein [Sodalis ligni]|uniref:Autotransporter family porin n=1 Tax=Sodalis ligni TaxID=2697027 RepID=A0A4R1NER3_9GAMM|nr:autotransporter outer membrane beta-barrel domain-containing protein [Sodalis ligni]TCL04191.1 autotransporter family porin [Sodalis ligni]
MTNKVNSLATAHLDAATILIDQVIPFQSNAKNKFNIITAALALSVLAIPEKARAACFTAADGVSIICDASSVQTTTVGTGPGLNNVNVNVLPSARIDTGELAAISLDSNADITLGNGAAVQNTTTAGSGSGLWGKGGNIIEFNDNTLLTVNKGAQVLALGRELAFENNAVHVHGSGNTIINHGLIHSAAGPAIRFESNTGINIVDNYGTISMSMPFKIVMDSEYTHTSIAIINRAGGEILGAILLGRGDTSVTLEAGSSINGSIFGGGGNNSLILDGMAGSSQALGFGTGYIRGFQTLTKNGAGEWSIPIDIDTFASGAPMALGINDGRLTLTGKNTNSGNTAISGGTLAAGAVNAFSPRSAYSVAPAGTMDLMGFDQSISHVTNAGAIKLNGSNGTELNITGDYVGDNGRVIFNAKLTGDAAYTDRLIIGGDTSGTTEVVVNNIGGRGRAIANVVELISVGGASDGDFKQAGRIVAGAYDYTLKRGAGAYAANWYLTRSTAAPRPVPGGPGTEMPGAGDQDNDGQGTGEAHFEPEEMIERPEDGAYAANLAAANTLFSAGLDTRPGTTAYIDPITGEQRTTSLWMINTGGHNRFTDGSGQLKTQGNRYVLQMGGDIGRWSSNSIDSFRLGVMGGYGRARSNTASRVSGYGAKGSVNGYSIGLYGTWHADAAGRSGLYIDGWTQYGWFDNTVAGQDLASENYTSKGFTASLESGYAFNVGEDPAKNATYHIQPKAQAIWMNVRANNHTETGGTQITGNGNGNIQTRLGIKAFMNACSERDKGKDRLFQPFIEANWVHNSKNFGSSLDDITINASGAANIGELKLGVNGRLNKNFNISGSVGQQVGNKGYSDTAGMLGIKYLF